MSTLDGQENWQTQSSYCIDAADTLRHGKSVSSSESSQLLQISNMGSTYSDIRMTKQSPVPCVAPESTVTHNSTSQQSHRLEQSKRARMEKRIG